MKNRKSLNVAALCLFALLIAISGGCKKKVPVAPPEEPAPPPPPPKPTATVRVAAGLRGGGGGAGSSGGATGPLFLQPPEIQMHSADRHRSATFTVLLVLIILHSAAGV